MQLRQWVRLRHVRHDLLQKVHVLFWRKVDAPKRVQLGRHSPLLAKYDELHTLQKVALEHWRHVEAQG